MEQITALYLVPTPIGNLGDLTIRSLEILKSVDLILAEDTRHSRKLLDHYDVITPMRPFHQHNEHRLVDEIADQLIQGRRMALVSDAGTPGISDPGYLLARKCIERGIKFEVLPGATAIIPALILSGLPNHNFVYEGFMPVKKGRSTAFTRLADEARTIILYESPHKIIRTLSDILSYWGDRQVAVCRELTKKFEECRRGPVSEHLEHFESHAPKGEFVLAVEGKPRSTKTR